MPRSEVRSDPGTERRFHCQSVNSWSKAGCAFSQDLWEVFEMAKTVVGLFDDFSTAEQVVRDLENNGFSRDDISLIARNTERGYRAQGTTTRAEGSQAGEGAAAGAGTGAVLGGLAGLLVGLGALAIPGIGPI